VQKLIKSIHETYSSDISIPGTLIEGTYSSVPSSSYWKNIILAIPNGATHVRVIHNNHDAEAGKIDMLRPIRIGRDGLFIEIIK
jgi:hypothetical protein